MEKYRKMDLDVTYPMFERSSLISFLPFAPFIQTLIMHGFHPAFEPLIVL